jgi:hypothetical protein
MHIDAPRDFDAQELFCSREADLLGRLLSYFLEGLPAI